MRLKSLGSIAVWCLLVSLTVPAAAIVRTWDNDDGDNDWSNSNNWDPAGGPDIDDDLIVLSGAPETTGNIESTGGGSITVESSSASATFGGLSIGHDGNATLDVLDGGTVYDDYGYLGYHDGDNGTAEVNDAGWVNNLHLFVGNWGTGVLNVRNGGTVSNVIGYVGFTDTGNGTITVEDDGSTWDNSGSLYVGYMGEATLNVLAGGHVSCVDAFLADDAVSTGTVTVDDATWTSSGSVYVGGSATAAGGTAELTV